MSDWRDSAACLDEDPELFFPIGNTGPAILQIEEAKAVCRRCDVVETCLRWAIDSGQDAGVWGGLSEDERRNLKRRNARARRADASMPDGRQERWTKPQPAERPPAPDTASLVPADPLRQRLIRVPLSSSELAALSDEAAPVSKHTIQKIRGGRRKTVYPGTVARIDALIERGWASLAEQGKAVGA